MRQAVFPPSCIVCDRKSLSPLCTTCCPQQVVPILQKNTFSLWPYNHRIHNKIAKLLKDSNQAYTNKNFRNIITESFLWLFRKPTIVHPVPTLDPRHHHTLEICRVLCELPHVNILWQPPLHKIKITRKQALLSRRERQENTLKAYSCPSMNKPIISDYQHVIIDDIVTTGTTLIDCQRALEEAGIANDQIYRFTLFYAQ